MTEILICPICRKLLHKIGNSLKCENGHSYDVARSGYVNLLPPGKKSNAQTGDPEEMVIARRDFLARGFYDEYVRRCAALSRKYSEGDIEVILDAACGEGHHTCVLAKEMSTKFTLGIDAAKKAADVAMKNAKRENLSDIMFAAGNIFSLPICDGSCDLVTVLFAPIPHGEAHRVLKDGGLLTVCSAGKDHLFELRRMIYDEVRIKETEVDCFDGFKLCERENISYGIHLSNGELNSLFMMTPFYMRSTAEAKARIQNAVEADVTVSVDCTVYRKI